MKKLVFILSIALSFCLPLWSEVSFRDVVSQGPEALGELLATKDIDAQDERGKTFLHWAVALGRTDVVKILMKRGAASNVRDNEEKTPLDLAFSKDGLFSDEDREKRDVIAYILISGDAIRIKDDPKAQQAVLFWAVRKNNFELLKKYLGNRKIDDIRDDEGNTLLHGAVSDDQTLMVEFLINEKADVTAQNVFKETVLLKAAANEGEHNLTILNKLLVRLEDLGKMEEALQAQDRSGMTPLHRAASNRGSGILEELLKRLSGKPQLKERILTNGITPMYKAVQQGRINNIAILLDHESPVDASVLKQALERQEWQDLITLLLGRGANLNVPDDQGETVLQKALQDLIESIKPEGIVQRVSGLVFGMQPDKVLYLIQQGAHVKDQGGADISEIKIVKENQGWGDKNLINALLVNAMQRLDLDDVKEYLAMAEVFDFKDEKAKEVFGEAMRSDNAALKTLFQDELNKRFLDAVEKVDTTSTEEYLALGADVNTPDANDKRPLEFAVEYYKSLSRFPSFYKKSRTLELIKLLVEHRGTPLNIIEDEKYFKDDELKKLVLGVRLLEEIGKSDPDKEKAKELIVAGARVDLKDATGKTARDYAKEEVAWLQDMLPIVPDIPEKVLVQVLNLAYKAGAGAIVVGSLLGRVIIHGFDCYWESLRLRTVIASSGPHSLDPAETLRVDEILAHEEEWSTKNRKERALAALKGFLKDPDLSLEQVPSVGFCFSGGGVRAMLETLGFLKGADELKILDVAQYASGLSGSTWALNPWLASGMPIRDYCKQVPERLTRPVAEYHTSMDKGDIQQMIMALLRLYYSGQSLGVVDLYGFFLGHMLLKGLPGVKNPFDVTLSSLESKISSRDYPFILSTAVLGEKLENGYRKSVEFSPFAVGSFEAGTFIPAWALGRPFDKEGSSKLVTPKSLYHGEKAMVGMAFLEKVRKQEEEVAREERDRQYYGHELPLAYLMGLWGSAFSIGMYDALLEGTDNLKPLLGESCFKNPDIQENSIQFMKMIIAKFASKQFDRLIETINKQVKKVNKLKVLTDTERWAKLTDPGAMREYFEHDSLIAESINNFAKSTLSKEDTITLVDGGFQVVDGKRLNLGILPLLERKMDVIIICDASVDLKGAPALKAAETLAGKRGLPFPEIKYEGIDTKHISVHYDDKEGTPIIVYMPGIRNENFRDPNFNPADTTKYPFTGTLNFTYTEEQSNKLMDLIALNVRQSKDELGEVFKKAVERKKTKKPSEQVGS